MCLKMPNNYVDSCHPPEWRFLDEFWWPIPEVAKKEKDFSLSVFTYLRDRNPKATKTGTTKCKEFFKRLAQLSQGEQIPTH